MKKRLICLAAIAAFLLTLLPGCGNSGTPAVNTVSDDASVAEKIEAAKNPDGTFPEAVLRVGWPGTGTWTGVQGLTYKLGYFDEELAKVNATIEVTGFANTGPEINAALTGGSLDAGLYGDVPAVQIKSKGTETTLLGGYLADSPTWLAVTPDITTVADLKGKKIGVDEIGGTPYQVASLWLEQNGIVAKDNKEVTFVPYSDGNLEIEAAEKGEIDAAAIWDPFGSLAVQNKGFVKIFDLSTEPGFADKHCCFLYASSKLIEENPQEVKDILIAYQQGAGMDRGQSRRGRGHHHRRQIFEHRGSRACGRARQELPVSA